MKKDKLSKKEKIKIEKEKEKQRKKIDKIIIISIIILIFSIWIYFSSKNITTYKNPIVNPNQVPNQRTHWHPHLTIIINNQTQIIPANIGISPGKESSTHTHTDDGKIHIESLNPKANPETFSLGYFFNEWGKSFNKTCILDKCIRNNSNDTLKMYVNGKENFEFENYIFKGDGRIKIIFTTKN